MIHMRPFTLLEQNNMKFLVNMDVKFTQVQITSTGLAKSILDATAPMRAYFVEEHLHDYKGQPQGPENKVVKKAFILTAGEAFQTQISFYRPKTKKGDPRLWIYNLAKHTVADDIYALFHIDGIIYVVNLTQIDIECCYHSLLTTPLKECIAEIYHHKQSVAKELLAMFHDFSGRWFESEVTADTGIGRTIESMFGIKMNSSKLPDYKGIELKSNREKRSSRKNILFTQVPDWDISYLKSGKEIVQHYGYTDAKSGRLTYQNTVQSASSNSQNLILNVNETKELLELQAQHATVEDVVVWRLLKLHERLMSKHRETFWIEVENRMDNGREYFRYSKIEHTRNPNIGQFDVLLAQSFITVDLLLSRPSGNGDTFSFKIKKKAMPLLFPESVVHIV